MAFELGGKVVDGAGAGKNGLTVKRYTAANWETFIGGGSETITETVTTDADGLWAMDTPDITGTWIVVVEDGTKKYVIDARNEIQLTKLDIITDMNVDTINEHTSGNGVVIDGVTLKDGGGTLTADLTLNDNVKLTLGTGGDADIYYDTTDLIINSAVAGSGKTRLTGGDVEILNGLGLIIGHATQLATQGITTELQVLGTGDPDSSIHIGRASNDASPPRVFFSKDRAATLGTFTLVQDNDQLGEIRWMASDNGDLGTNVALFGAEVDDASPAASDIGAALFWSTAPGGGTGISEAMRLSAAGELIFKRSADSAAVADQVSIGRYEIGATNTVLAISQETAVVAAVTESDYSHAMQVRINGVTYHFMLASTLS